MISNQQPTSNLQQVQPSAERRAERDLLAVGSWQLDVASQRGFTPYHFFHKSDKGFTILLAALVASLVLTLGISVFTIAKKQLILSSIGKTSQFAFYTADTAAECALYWDTRHSAFSITEPVTPISCAGNSLIEVEHSDFATSPPASFTFEFEPNGYCARVSVTKNTVHPRTVIHADGFSTDCASIGLSARSLQRSVELTY